MTLEVDNHEPSEIVDYLWPAVPVQVNALNSAGYADYKYNRPNDRPKQWERKTWLNLFSSLDDIEFQLFNQMQKDDVETGLLIEGIVEPNPKGEGYITYHHPHKTPTIMVPGFTPKGNMTKIYAWLHQVAQFMEVQYTSSPLASATALAAFYHNDQKPTHDTFKRQLKRTVWRPNTQVARLLGAAYNDTNIGTEKAERIIGKFGTFWNAIHSDPKELAEVEGISINGAKLFLSRIGRPDITG